MPELSEIIASLNEYVGDDKAKAKEAAQALRASAAAVAQPLIDVGAGLTKGDAAKRARELEAQLKERDDALAERDERIAALEAAKPDTEKLLSAEREKAAKKIKAAEEKGLATRQSAKERERQRRIAETSAALDKLHPVYRNTVVPNQYGPLIEVDDDLNVRIKTPDGTGYYDMPDGRVESALAAFTKDITKAAPPEFVLSRAEGGSGLGGGGGAGAVTRNAKVEEKRIENARAAVQGAL